MATNSSAPFRSTTLGILAAIAGCLLWVASIGIFFGSAAAAMSEAWYLGLVGLPVGIAVFGAGYSLIALGRRLRARGALDVMADDARPPVLYCRSFSEDKGITGLEDQEEIEIARAFQGVGPVVGIGKPGDRLRVPGAARRYIEGDDWRPEVERLMDRSRLIIIHASLSDGLIWEYKTALQRAAPNKVVIIPPGDSSEWQQFIDTTGHGALPSDTQNADMICLDTEGKPRLVWRTNREKSWWEDRQLIQRLLFKSSF